MGRRLPSWQQTGGAPEEPLIASGLSGGVRFGRMRFWVPVALGAVGLGILAGPTTAADQTVNAVAAGDGDYLGENQFTPRDVTVTVGESVAWLNNGGTHNVKFEDGQFTQPPEPALPASWPSPSPKRTFTQPGLYQYYCAMHGAPGGAGMAGTVLVKAAPSPSPGPAPSPGPDPTPPPGPSPTTTPGVTPVKIESLSLAGRRFCARKGKDCPRPGVQLVIDLSAPTRVNGTLKRRPLRGNKPLRDFGPLDFGSLGAKRQKLRFTRTSDGRRLVPGRYQLTIQAGQGSRVLNFAVAS